MHSFYIEMGQGIAARGDFRVCTSDLSSCRFLVVHNPTNKMSGAFHYPGGYLKNNNEPVKKAMLEWAGHFKWQQITVIEGVTPIPSDETDLWNFFLQVQCPTDSHDKGLLTPEVKFENGKTKITDYLGFPLRDAGFIQLHKKQVGHYDVPIPHILFGQDQN